MKEGKAMFQRWLRLIDEVKRARDDPGKKPERKANNDTNHKGTEIRKNKV